ncbi:MAG: 2-C-methyl-D-erythritol 4-phosphate cytidylyltransferase [Gammaproteobacteria bacterium]|nr:2-C-methyl-D-erythritol 4-phosphate cytidylyltransferase [Gammaproteobacteria bacterium]
MTKLWAVIPAGGAGLRYGSKIPKQYITVAGLAVLEHVLDAFLTLDVFESIVVPVPSQDNNFHGLAGAKHESVVSIAGGLERADSVYAGLDWIQAQGAGKHDWVFVHDAARPLITQDELRALLGVIDIPDCPGVVLGVPASDTLKRVDQIRGHGERTDICIAETVDRTGLWHAMTPQVFQLSELIDALNQVKASGLFVTDEAQALEATGTIPWLVRGLRSNIKLTYPEDLELIEAILAGRQEVSI